MQSLSTSPAASGVQEAYGKISPTNWIHRTKGTGESLNRFARR